MPPPNVPPITAFGLKAPVKIRRIASGIFFTLSKIIIKAQVIYKIAINGTMYSVTFAMRLMPP